jgi:predicted nucleic acid-binding protein
MGFKTLYWDANIFHALFQNEQGRADICKRVEKAASQGNLDIYTSTVTFVECVWLKNVVGKTGQLNKLSSRHEEVIQKYFQRSYIVPINCDRQIAEAARQLLWQYALKPKDAIHVASAIYQHVDVMHSYDNDDLVKLDGKIGVPPLKICHPGVGDGLDLPML